MQEKLISPETAKLAKEKGFDWLVTSHYGETPVVGHEILAEPGDQFGTPYEPDNYNKSGWDFKKWSAPTQSLLQKWLREVCNKDVFVIRSGDRYYPVNNSAGADLYLLALLMENLRWKSYATYEEAMEMALYEGLLGYGKEN